MRIVVTLAVAAYLAHIMSSGVWYIIGVQTP